MIRSILKKVSVFLLVRILLAPFIFIAAVICGVIQAECELVTELSSATIDLLKDLKKYVMEGLKP